MLGQPVGVARLTARKVIIAAMIVYMIAVGMAVLYMVEGGLPLHREERSVAARKQPVVR